MLTRELLATHGITIKNSPVDSEFEFVRTSDGARCTLTAAAQDTTPLDCLIRCSRESVVAGTYGGNLQQYRQRMKSQLGITFKSWDAARNQSLDDAYQLSQIISFFPEEVLCSIPC